MYTFPFNFPFHYVQGKHNEAELLFKRAVAIYDNVHGPGHPDVAAPLGNLVTSLEKNVRVKIMILRHILWLPFKVRQHTVL